MRREDKVVCAVVAMSVFVFRIGCGGKVVTHRRIELALKRLQQKIDTPPFSKQMVCMHTVHMTYVTFLFMRADEACGAHLSQIHIDLHKYTRSYVVPLAFVAFLALLRG